MAGSILRRIFSNTSVENMADPKSPQKSTPISSPSATSPRASLQHNKTIDTTPEYSSRRSIKKPRSQSTSSRREHDRRTSYDSVREVQDVPQSFRRQTRDRHQDEAVLISYPPSPVVGATQVTRNERPSIGRRTNSQASRKSFSFSNLRQVAQYALDESTSAVQDDNAAAEQVWNRQAAPIETLPTEILENIMWQLTGPNPNNEYASPYTDLVTSLQVSRALYVVGLRVLYREVSIPHSIKFSKFMNNIERDPVLATLVRRLDFSRYSNIGFGRTRQASSEILNVTPKTLLRCLELTVNLREFLVHEHVDDELDERVLEQVFSMPSIEALDFCACSSTLFTTAFTNVATTKLSKTITGSLKRLSLHECTTLQAPVFESLLPLLPNLTHLDVAHTLITDEALFSIPSTARVTHLNLGRCTRITGENVVRFLTRHPAVKDSLVFLNLMAEPSRYRLLSASDLTTLLPKLPRTLRSLNIGGSRLASSHLQALRPLLQHLEELGIADADLSQEDIESFFTPPTETSRDHRNGCTLRYLDLTGISSISQFSLQYAKPPSSKPLVSDSTYPLEVIELSDDVLESFRRRSTRKPSAGQPRPEWVVRDLGRRGWLVRARKPGSKVEEDDGRRNWKMGARWWGMRKVSVAEMNVGGMYGFYAFKRI